MLSAAPVAPLSSHQLLLILVQVGLLLMGAVALGQLAARVHLPAVVGELCAGILLGPSVLGQFLPSMSHRLMPADPAQFHLLDGVGQIGVVLLVGITGVEIDHALIRRRGRQAMMVGVTALLVPLLCGTCVGLAAPASLIPASTSRPLFACFLGTALGVSALPVIAKTLTDMRLIHRDISQLTLAAAVVDDVGGWLLLSVLSALAIGGNGAGGTLGWSIVRTFGILATALVPARFVIMRLIAWASRNGPLPTTATVTIILLLSSAATQALNLEALIGAFIAGVIIGTAGPEIRTRLVSLHHIVMAVLAPVFFATAGLRLDLADLAQMPVLTLAAVVLLVAVAAKMAGAFAAARIQHLTRWEALALGAGLNARGVIQIVIATVGLRLGVLTGGVYTVVIVVAIATSAMAPPLIRIAMRRMDPTVEEQLRARDAVPILETGGLPLPGTETFASVDSPGPVRTESTGH